MSVFLFATGIENSYPTIAGKDGKQIRVDEMAKTGHYECWKEDFQLTQELGIEFLRYGPPYYKTHIGPGRYDWSFADETFHALREMNITPIADLCHFGVPDWIGSFQNSDWPPHFAEYAKAFASRYPWVRLFTPVNEIYIAAKFSALTGCWNERLSSDRAFVTAIKNLCKANVMGMHAILDVQPRAAFIQSESSEYNHPQHPDQLSYTHFLNERRFLALDFSYGHQLDVTMYEYVLDNGMTREEYHWFPDNHIRSRCIMGTDYYATNEFLVHPDGSTSASGEIFGYYVLTHQYFNRYHLPVMHTETNTEEPRGVDWLRKEWANVFRLKQDGVPILGFTWYSLQDQVDWDSGLTENAGHDNALGLVDLNRNVRPVGRAYRELIKRWRDMLGAGVFTLGASYLTETAARLAAPARC